MKPSTFVSGSGAASAARSSAAVGAFVLALCLLPSVGSAQLQTIWIDDLAEGPPVVKIGGPGSTFATAAPLPSTDFISTPDTESFIANLVGVGMDSNAVPTSVIWDEPGHTATSDELSVNVILPVGGPPGPFYQISWFSDTTEAGLGFPPKPTNPVEDGTFQVGYRDQDLLILARSDVDVPDSGSSATLLLLALVAVAGAAQLRAVRGS